MTTIDPSSLQSQPLPQLTETIFSALGHPLVLTNLSTIAHHNVISRLVQAPQDRQAQFAAKLLTVFATGTTIDLLNIISTPENQDLCPLLSPSIYLNLQLLTLISALEQILLSQSHINALSAQSGFIRIPFTTLFREMNQTHAGQQLSEFFTKHQQTYPNLSLLTAQPQSILTLITTAFSRQLISGMIHNVIQDLDGVLELRAILVPRPVISSLPPNSPKSTVSIDDMICALETLISATDATVAVV